MEEFEGIRLKEIMIFVMNKIPMYFLFTDITVPQEHSECPLVEADSTTSQFISLCIGLSWLHLTFKLTEKPSAVFGVKQTHQHLLIQFTHHAVWQFTLVKVKQSNI